IEPLYFSKSAHELIEVMLQPDSTRGAYDIVRAHWKLQNLRPDFEKGWRQALHDGLVQNSQLPTVNSPSFARDTLAIDDRRPARPAGLELNFYPDPTLWDGCFANNAWLQEMPKPITKLT